MSNDNKDSTHQNPPIQLEEERLKHKAKPGEKHWHRKSIERGRHVHSGRK